jgi:hypothetical protein
MTQDVFERTVAALGHDLRRLGAVAGANGEAGPKSSEKLLEEVLAVPGGIAGQSGHG